MSGESHHRISPPLRPNPIRASVRPSRRGYTRKQSLKPWVDARISAGFSCHQEEVTRGEFLARVTRKPRMYMDPVQFSEIFRLPWLRFHERFLKAGLYQSFTIIRNLQTVVGH